MAAALFAIGGAAAGGVWWWNELLTRPGPLPEARPVVIPRGGTPAAIGALADAGAIRAPWQFGAAAWWTRHEGPLHAAEFLFPAHASLREALTILRSGRAVEHHLTIAEGLTAQQIAAVIGKAEFMTGEIKTPAEGTLLPQTYDYEYGTDRSALAARARVAMDKQLRTLWADRAPGLPLTSPHDALVLASIVERETAKPEERPHVASVYLNRLRLGMKLQADPTVVYAASGGAGVLDHKLTRAELNRDDPYNTYRVTGLPPGPICSPGAGSLHAVLHPAETPDLFFVADGTGGHVFSRDLKTHDAAVGRLRALAPGGAHGSPD